MVVHYEVYVLEGRGWMLHARHPRSGRDAALAEAKELEQALRIHVKVVRETYHTEDNSFEEAEIYVTGGRASPSGFRNAERMVGGRKGAAGKSAAASHHGADGHADRSGKRKGRGSAARLHLPPLIVPLLVIVAVALAAAFLSVRLLPELITALWKMGLPITLTADSYSQLLMGVFIGVFLLVSVPLGMRFLVPKRVIHPADPPGPYLRMLQEKAERERAVKESLDKLVQEEQKRQTMEMLGLGAEPESPDEDEDEDGDTDAEDVPPDLVTEKNKKDQKEPASSAPKTGEAESKDPIGDKKAKADKASAKAPTIASVQPMVTEFLTAAVAKARQSVPHLDSYNKFALHLYMAGAVECLCDFKKMGSNAKSELVALALEGLGTRGAVAEKFYEKLDEYLVEPRYLGMVQAGRDAMSDYMLGSKDSAHNCLKDKFRDWNKKPDQKGQIMTVMFTDMVGSTDMTQARGDSAAQEIVRKHNSIVRGALAQYAGKEIKHTGDGIMASFNSSASAVEACVAIQKQVKQHNGRVPHQELHLRIGLNAGEPIQEEDDLFGATIQLAARVCAATNTDQILCTAVVRDLSANKASLKFRSVGERVLKGFKTPVTLYEVEW